MNAAAVTHVLKVIGGNTRMWVGVIVVALAVALLVNFVETERQKRLRF